jgi:hypothetical protein
MLKEEKSYGYLQFYIFYSLATGILFFKQLTVDNYDILEGNEVLLILFSVSIIALIIISYEIFKSILGKLEKIKN